MGPNPNGPLSELLELLDTQVEGSVKRGSCWRFLGSCLRFHWLRFRMVFLVKSSSQVGGINFVLQAMDICKEIL